MTPMQPPPAKLPQAQAPSMLTPGSHSPLMLKRTCRPGNAVVVRHSNEGTSKERVGLTSRPRRQRGCGHRSHLAHV